MMQPETEEFRDCIKIGSQRRKWIVNVWKKYEKSMDRWYLWRISLLEFFLFYVDGFLCSVDR